MKATIKIISILLVLLVFQSCSKDDTPTTPPVIEETNNAPSINAQTFTVDENIADNIPIGEVVASDLDDDALAFSISANDGNLFEISEAGVLSLDDLQLLDFETTQSHTITVQVSDGKTSTEALITINVTDIDDTSFVTTWETTGSNETVTIPTRADEFTYDYTIDWGDGTIQSNRTGDATHSYATAGTYTLSISGVFPAIALVNNDFSRGQLRTVERWGNIQWQTMLDAFRRVNTLAINAADAPDLSQVTNMATMFALANNLSGDISDWNVSNVTNMFGMFRNSPFNYDISGWDVSNVIDMQRMFDSTPFNQDISNWDVGNVINMESIFDRSSFNQDISNWDVSKVINMRFMFIDSPFNQNISNWDVSSVTNMSAMFNESPFNQDISDWNVGNVTDMSFMFRGSSFNQDISNWDVSNVITMDRMFDNSGFNQNINTWNVGNVTIMQLMFSATPFNQDISDWDVNNVANCDGFADDAPLTPANTPNFTNCTF